MNQITFIAYWSDVMNRCYFAGPKDTEKKVSNFIKENGLDQKKFVTSIYNKIKEFEELLNKSVKIKFVIEAKANAFIIQNAEAINE